jgi:hypothetical protein
MGSFHWPWIPGPSQVNWFGFHLCWRRVNNLESILLISPVSDLSEPVSPLQDARMQIYNSSGCRNHSALHGRMRYSSALGLQTQKQQAKINLLLRNKIGGSKMVTRGRKQM